MKKTIGIIVAVLAVAAMVLLLVGNKKKMQEQTTSVEAAGSAEVVSVYTVKSGESVRDIRNFSAGRLSL